MRRAIVLMAIQLAFASACTSAADIEVLFQAGLGGYDGAADVSVSVDGRISHRNLGAMPSLDIWHEGGVAFLRFDVSKLPRATRVKKATLEMFAVSCGFSSDQIKRQWPVKVYTCNSHWSEGTGVATEDKRDGATLTTSDGTHPWPDSKPTGCAGPAIGSTVIGGAAKVWVQWILDTSAVERWISMPEQNFGLMVWGKPPGKAISFASREAPLISLRPIVRLQLSVPDADIADCMPIHADLKNLESPTVGCWYHPFYSLKRGELQHWTDVKNGQRPWPIGGRYDMEDRKTFDHQVKQIKDCGISFLVFDDTNCVDVDDWQIDRRIKTWFDFMDALPANERLLLCIAAGGELNVHNNQGSWLKNVDYLYRQYAHRPSYARLDGKPLFLWYIDKDAWPEWTDDRWTVKKAYAHHRPESKTGFSWGVRGVPSPDKECMPVMVGWHRPDSPDVFPRNNGEFYQRGWLEVLRRQPRYVLLASWNEHAEACTIEDTTEYGDQYRRLTTGYIAAARHKRLEGFVYTVEGTTESYKWVKGQLVKTRLPRGRRTDIVVPKDYLPR